MNHAKVKKTLVIVARAVIVLLTLCRACPHRALLIQVETRRLIR
jgi:hypothetical protein